MADRNETCPTCGSKDAPRVCCPGTHAPDDHDSTCEPCWDPWHAATPAPRDATPTDGDVIAWAVFKGDSYEWVHDDEAKARENERDGYRVVPLVPAAVSATGREAELREAELAVLDAAVKWCSPNADDGMTDLLLDAVNKYAALRGTIDDRPQRATPTTNPAPAPASGAAKANPKEP